MRLWSSELLKFFCAFSQGYIFWNGGGESSAFEIWKPALSRSSFATKAHEAYFAASGAQFQLTSDGFDRFSMFAGFPGGFQRFWDIPIRYLSDTFLTPIWHVSDTCLTPKSLQTVRNLCGTSRTDRNHPKPYEIIRNHSNAARVCPAN